MGETATRDKLTGICREDGCRLFFEEPLSGHSTIRIGGKAMAWVEVPSVDKFLEVRRVLERGGGRHLVVGNCSNMLFPDGRLTAVLVKLRGGLFSGIRFEDNRVTAGAGVALGSLVCGSCAKGLAGLEGLVGIPASVGGAVANNASYLSGISDHLVKVRVIDGNFRDIWIDKEDIRFEYRGSSLKGKTVVEAVFELEKADADKLKRELKGNFLEKMKKQPLEKKTLGCVFKNPPGGHASGELIDKAGMKGACVGGAKVSEKHANFIINDGGARSSDVTALIDMVKRKVFEKFSITLEPEIEIIKD
jgi:UDP-N-acetylmuramate dehydrogenase